LTIVDSCGWLEYYRNGPQADRYAPYLQAEDLAVPTIVMYEVYKVLRRDLTERVADLAVTRMRAQRIIPLDDRLAVEAADHALEQRLAMADAIVYATARTHGATLVTGDGHFADLPGVEYVGPEVAQ
jgi:predicted nucleic acid-binding protein